MKSITIRNIEDLVYEKIKKKSQIEKTSINKLIVRTLTSEFTNKNTSIKEFHDLDDLFGTWTEEEYNNIMTNVEEQRKIDNELWT